MRSAWCWRAWRCSCWVRVVRAGLHPAEASLEWLAPFCLTLEWHQPSQITLGKMSLGVAIRTEQLALGHFGEDGGLGAIRQIPQVKLEGFLLRIPVMPRKCSQVLVVAAPDTLASYGHDQCNLPPQTSGALGLIVLVAIVCICVLAEPRTKSPLSTHQGR